MGKTAEAVAEGVSIACSAARLVMRNHILVATIAGGGNFDAEGFARFAQQTLISLAEEQETAAELARKQRKIAWGKFSDPDGTHDYRDRDMRNLRRRQKQYLGVAKQLRARAADADALRALVEEARDAAWGDVESNLHRRLKVEGMRADLDPDYEVMRGARMQALRLVDIPRLASRRRSLAAGENTDPENTDRDSTGADESASPAAGATDTVG